MTSNKGCDNCHESYYTSGSTYSGSSSGGTVGYVISSGVGGNSGGGTNYVVSGGGGSSGGGTGYVVSGGGSSSGGGASYLVSGGSGGVGSYSTGSSSYGGLAVYGKHLPHLPNN